MNASDLREQDYRRYLVFGFICILLTGIASGVMSTWLGDLGKLLLLLCALYNFAVFFGILKPPKSFKTDDES